MAAGEAFAQSDSSGAESDEGSWFYTIIKLIIVAIGIAGIWMLRKRAKANADADKSSASTYAMLNNQKNRGSSSNASRKANANVGARYPLAVNAPQTSVLRTASPGLSAAPPQTFNRQAFGGSVGSSPVAVEAAGNSADYMNSWQLTPPPPIEPLPESDDPSLLEAIERIREDEADETVRELAVRVLSAFKAANAIEALRQVALYDQSAKLRIEAINALGSFDHEAVFELILLACADPSREVRAAAARTLTRLNFNRADAFVRVIESRDEERMRLASLACLEAGLATRAFERITASDPKQSYEAFAILTLLVKSGEFAPILQTIKTHPNQSVKLATIKVLHNLNPAKMQPELKRLAERSDLPAEIKTALDDLIFHLNQTV